MAATVNAEHKFHRSHAQEAAQDHICSQHRTIPDACTIITTLEVSMQLLQLYRGESRLWLVASSINTLATACLISLRHHSCLRRLAGLAAALLRTQHCAAACCIVTPCMCQESFHTAWIDRLPACTVLTSQGTQFPSQTLSSPCSHASAVSPTCTALQAHRHLREPHRSEPIATAV